MSSESAAPIVENGVGRGFPQVKGECPSCHRSALFLGVGGYVTCASLDCKDPTAATEMLETHWHNRSEPQS